MTPKILNESDNNDVLPISKYFLTLLIKYNISIEEVRISDDYVEGVDGERFYNIVYYLDSFVDMIDPNILEKISKPYKKLCTIYGVNIDVIIIKFDESNIKYLTRVIKINSLYEL